MYNQICLLHSIGAPAFQILATVLLRLGGNEHGFAHISSFLAVRYVSLMVLDLEFRFCSFESGNPTSSARPAIHLMISLGALCGTANSSSVCGRPRHPLGQPTVNAKCMNRSADQRHSSNQCVIAQNDTSIRGNLLGDALHVNCQRQIAEWSTARCGGESAKRCNTCQTQ